MTITGALTVQQGLHAASVAAANATLGALDVLGNAEVVGELEVAGDAEFKGKLETHGDFDIRCAALSRDGRGVSLPLLLALPGRRPPACLPAR